MNAPGQLIVPEARAAQLPAVAPSEAGALISMIERASRDPGTDIQKMRELFALRREILDEQNKLLFSAAMNAAQAEMTPISTNMTNPQTRSNYASYDQLDRAIRPIYTRHGFSISFNEAESPKPEHVRVICYVAHASGYERTYHTDMPADGKGAKGGDVMTKTHAVGAAKSYGKRYIVRDLFNLSIGEEDVDGNDDPDTIGPGQVKELEALIVSVKADKAKFLKYLKVDSVDKILLRSYVAAKNALEGKRQAKPQ